MRLIVGGADTAWIARENRISNPDKILEDFTGFVVANKMKSSATFPNDAAET